MEDLKSKVPSVRKTIVDQKIPLKDRFRCIFALRNIGGEEAIEALADGFNDPSELFRHEVAYCLGQLEDSHAIPFLKKVLEDLNEHPMVRHEAAEALGAIANKELIEYLTPFLKDPMIDVAETVEIAVDRIKWFQDEDNRKEYKKSSVYMSSDPAPAFPTSMPTKEVAEVFLNSNRSLFDRYRALFALRDRAPEEAAVKAICDGLNEPKSALFRHEVAFVLGQIQSPKTSNALAKTLELKEENPMVRHEAAEALGSIATNEAVKELQKYIQDPHRVVKESVEVALDISDYNNSGDFQYAKLTVNQL